MMSHVLFLLFVTVSVFVQGLTGFALSLVLLSMIAVTGIVSLTQATNAAAIIILVNAYVFLKRRGSLRLERSMWPAAVASLIGTFVGTVAQVLLANNAYDVLRLLLGICIVGGAILLLAAAKPMEGTSRPGVFCWVGGFSGILGGLFSSPGPPLAYLMYRQPWPLARIQETLVFFFGMGAVLRLIILVPTGHFGMSSLILAAEATPVVILVSAYTARQTKNVSTRLVKNVTSALLILAGTGTIATAISALI